MSEGLRLSRVLQEAVAGSGAHAYHIPRPTKKGLIDKRSLRRSAKPKVVKKGDPKAGTKVPDKERTFELMRVYDLRLYDWGSGKRGPLIKGEGNICNRCGREHAVVWEVFETTPGQKRAWFVGSGCGPKILAGWSPEKSVLAQKKKEANIEAKAKGLIVKIKEMLELGRSFQNRVPPKEIEMNHDEDFSPKWDHYYYKGDAFYSGIKIKHGARFTNKDRENLKRTWVKSEIEKIDYDGARVAMQGYDGKNIKNMDMRRPENMPYDWRLVLDQYEDYVGNIKDLI